MTRHYTVERVKRLVVVEVEVLADAHGQADACSVGCPWWGKGFGGRGAVCTLFETTLDVAEREQRGGAKALRYLRTSACRRAQAKEIEMA